MNLSNFHKSLLGTDPTPEQQRLYTAFPKQRGYEGEQQTIERFTATFIVALSETWDRDTKSSINTVALAIPRPMESWCIEAINKVLDQVKARKKILPKPAIKQFVEAVKHVETGTRVFSVSTAPKRWVAFGFTKEQAPDWLKEALLA